MARRLTAKQRAAGFGGRSAMRRARGGGRRRKSGNPGSRRGGSRRPKPMVNLRTATGSYLVANGVSLTFTDNHIHEHARSLVPGSPRGTYQDQGFLLADAFSEDFWGRAGGGRRPLAVARRNWVKGLGWIAAGLILPKLATKVGPISRTRSGVNRGLKFVGLHKVVRV